MTMPTTTFTVTLDTDQARQVVEYLLDLNPPGHLVESGLSVIITAIDGALPRLIRVGSFVRYLKGSERDSDPDDIGPWWGSRMEVLAIRQNHAYVIDATGDADRFHVDTLEVVE